MDPIDATAVVIASSQCAVLGPSEFLQSEISAGGPMACTCISVQNGADHTVIADSNPMSLTLHVFGQSIVASTGIFFLPSAYDTFFFNSAPASFTWIGQ
jgi:hypothetical protein